MNQGINKTVSTLFLILITTFIFGQHREPRTEFEHWEGLTLEKEISKRLDLAFSVEGRWRTDPTELKQVYLELEPQYKILKWMKSGGGYRIAKRKKGFENRIYGFVEPHWDVNKDFYVEGRVRYDYEWEDSNGDGRWRFRLKPEWDFGKSEIHVLTELFYEEFDHIEQTRVALGYQYKLNKRNTLSLRTIVDFEEHENVLILSLGYKLEF